ncbi:hemin uptake protein HemP [Methylophilus medardicus]|uniref:Hemin uptake protein HemP n=1 Tax=Methylophilus medardicus TaxID=2588534 RepID=A0A5B8CUA6_9PROT|nr:hemin uptake protein HemP [Methylophilus medardicus]QDC44897.1 hemin uptake protein HemP [Methylophilus medardicus]QDC49904.1 hemin uptake protein HemP [Methylophilus medardicus]QDC53609.1 hemin uptake protein HemP [Methylophilus medardicus]
MINRLQSLMSEVQNAARVSPGQVPTIEARQLLGDAGVLAIMHAGETYQLTRTKQNKLLLTKSQVLAAPPQAKQDE